MRGVQIYSIEAGVTPSSMLNIIMNSELFSRLIEIHTVEECDSASWRGTQQESFICINSRYHKKEK